MKKRQIIMLVYSIFFFDLLVVPLPAKGQIYERKYYDKGREVDFYESQKCLSKNLKTVEINEGPTSSFYCIISRNFNEHGTIYKIEIRTGILTIYVGNNSDVIIDYPNKKRQYGTLHSYYISNEKIPIFMILRDRNPIIIPKY